MKMSSVRYLCGEGVKSAWKNRLMSLASVGVLVACMTIIGLAILITENVNKAIGNLEQQNVVMVYMKDYNWALYGEKDDASSDASSAEGQTDETPDANGIKSSDYVIHNDDEAKALCDKIAKIDNVAKVEYVSSQDGLDSVKDAYIFHAGTKLENGKFLTSGGRVLGITAVAENLDAAIEKAYKNVSKVSFTDVHYRKDIGIKK